MTRLALLVAGMLIVAGCTTQDASVEDVLELPFLEDVPPIPDLDSDLVRTGEVLYQANCASCHGVDLAGEDDWRASPDDNGVWKPPPMDATGHTWHHSDALLTGIILNGSSAEGSPMVGHRDRLSPADVDAILEFFKSTWGPQERAFQWTVTWQEQQRG